MIWDKANIAKLLELAATGASYTAIGKALGISKNAAIGKARRMKIDKSPAVQPRRIPIARAAPKPKPTKPTPPPPSAPVPDMKLLTMMELHDRDCRYPIGSGDEMLFCGRQRTGEKPYCTEHALVCYNPIKPKIHHSVRRL